MYATEKFKSIMEHHPELDFSGSAIREYGQLDGIRIFCSATLSLLCDSNNALAIGSINVDADKRSEGIGGKILSMLVEYADKHSVTLTLYARSYDKSPISSERLARWYESFGFKKTPRGHIRLPRDTR